MNKKPNERNFHTYKWDKLREKHDAFKTECFNFHTEQLKTITSYKKIKISSVSDLGAITTRNIFYIIFTDYEILKNDCKLELSFDNTKVKAIYRGETGGIAGVRLKSHLFNSRFKKDVEDKNTTDMKNCMKIDDDNVDIDSEKYKNFQWYVVLFRLDKADSTVRRELETAFDELYEKPLASKK